MNTPSELVAHFVIRGIPVASAHKGRVGVNKKTGKASYFPNKAWGLWFTSAIEQVEATLKQGGHQVVREPNITQTGPNKGKPCKNAHGQVTHVINPLFTKGPYRIVVYYHYPLRTYKRDTVGSVVMTTGTKRKPSRPVTLAFSALDVGNVSKGVIDALEEAGVIDNDRNVRFEPPVAVPFLADDEEAYVAVEVKYFDYNNADDWVVAWPCPVLLTDPRLYMPRVLESAHQWHVVKTQEKNHEDYLTARGEARLASTPKIRCRRCKIFVGAGCTENEIWWDVDEDRWGKQVVLICATCGARAFEKRPDYATQIQTRTLAALKLNGFSGTLPAPTDITGLQVYTLFASQVEQRLAMQYREERCLVPSSVIQDTSWASVDALRQAQQLSKYPKETHDNRKIRHADRPIVPALAAAQEPRTLGDGLERPSAAGYPTSEELGRWLARCHRAARHERHRSPNPVH